MVSCRRCRRHFCQFERESIHDSLRQKRPRSTFESFSKLTVGLLMMKHLDRWGCTHPTLSTYVTPAADPGFVTEETPASCTPLW